MSEQTEQTPPAPAPASISPEGFAKLVERLGLPTIIICVVGYIGYNEIISPIANKYAVMLDAVTESNTKLTEITNDLRQKLIEVGVANGATLAKISSNADEMIDSQGVINGKIDALTRATEDLAEKVDRIRKYAEGQ